MYDLYEMMAMITFVLGWYTVILAGHLALKSSEKMRLVWCPKLSTFSFVEAADGLDGIHGAVVKKCLLWPEYGKCGGGCLMRTAALSAPASERT
jgi:hypothetical protein